MLDFWRMESTSLLPSLSGPLWPGLVAPDRVLSMGQIELIDSLTSRVFANGLEDRVSIPGRVIPKTQNRYLMPPCLTLSTIRYGSRVKWSDPGKGVAPSSTRRCSSY